MSDNIDDEDKMIRKLEEHRDTKNMIIEIARLNNINVSPTTNNDSRGDFCYDEKDHEKLVKCIDEYLGDYKYEKE